MVKVRVKSNIVNVALESVITGHRIFWCRLKTDPKVQRIAYDPRIDRQVLFKEVEKKSSKNLPPHALRLFDLHNRNTTEE